MAFPHLAYIRTRGIAFLQPCARERRYFRGENCYTSPPDGLTAGTLRVFGLRGYVSRSIYQLKLVSLTQQKIPVTRAGITNYLEDLRNNARIRDAKPTRTNASTSNSPTPRLPMNKNIRKFNSLSQTSQEHE